jgi:hypothetical protein
VEPNACLHLTRDKQTPEPCGHAYYCFGGCYGLNDGVSSKIHIELTSITVVSEVGPLGVIKL